MDFEIVSNMTSSSGKIIMTTDRKKVTALFNKKQISPEAVRKFTEIYDPDDKKTTTHPSIIIMRPSEADKLKKILGIDDIDDLHTDERFFIVNLTNHDAYNRNRIVHSIVVRSDHKITKDEVMKIQNDIIDLEDIGFENISSINEVPQAVTNAIKHKHVYEL